MTPDHRHLAAFDPHTLLIAAVRYYAGRTTIQVSQFADELAEAWPIIPERTRTVIRRDLEWLFEHDDHDRARGWDRAMGSDVARRAWERVRSVWLAEQKENGQ